MKLFLATVVLLSSYQLVAISALCPEGRIIGNKCVQDCAENLDECSCNTHTNITYDSCKQECVPPKCYGSGKMTCKAEKNCTQICKPSECDMECNARQYCIQSAENESEMNCNSATCVQNCNGGNCKTMLCDGENCRQTCDEGGCAMNCTASVKVCVQDCTPKADCTLECHAQECHQTCHRGPRKCIILNSGFTAIPAKTLSLVSVFAAIKLQCNWF